MDETSAQMLTLETVNRVKADLEVNQNNLYRQNLSGDQIQRKKDEYEEEIKRLDALSVVKTTLAFTPDSQFIQKMWQTLSNKMGQNIVLDIILDKSIIGGVVIEADGKHQDFTLRRIFDAKTKL